MSAVTVASSAGEALSEEFERVFREHYRIVYRTAFHVTGSHQDAEDVLQTIFLRLIRADLPRDFRKNPKAYLYRAAVNASLDAVRARQRHVLTNNPDLFDRLVEPPSSYEEKDIHGQLRAAIATLHPNAAQVLILRYVHNYSDAEIAKMLGTSRGTVAVSLYRSRARLKKLIRTFLGEES